MKSKIMIVDDEKPIRELVAFRLENQGFQCTNVENGTEALRVIRTNRPSLVILDVMLPDINGLEVCKTIKSNPETQAIKVLLLSAKGQQEDQDKGFAAGADAYITKPFLAKQLLNAMERVLI
ncbi:response regulator [Deltaproteobacteria bacterium TL4]